MGLSKKNIIHPLHKKENKSDINRFKGIRLLSAFKILSKTLLRRVNAQVDNLSIEEHQAGFGESWWYTQQILNLKTILSYRNLSVSP